MTLRSLCGGLWRNLFRTAAVLALLAGPALAQRTPAFQDGQVAPGDALKATTQGRYGSAGALTGDALHTGINPHAIYDRGAIGETLHDAPTDGPYHAFELGHDADGNALISVQSYNGASAAGLKCDINGTITDCLGGSGGAALGVVRSVLGTSDTMTTDDSAVHWTGAVTSNRTQTLPGCSSGLDYVTRTVSDDAGIASLYPITLDPASGTIDNKPNFRLNWASASVSFQCDGVSNYKVVSTTLGTPAANTLPEQNQADLTARVAIINTGLANQPQSVALTDIRPTQHVVLHQGKGGVAEMIDPATGGDVHWAVNGGDGNDIYLDIAHLTLGGHSGEQIYHFVANGLATIYLDPGLNGLFAGYGLAGQMLQVLPNEAVSVSRNANGLYYIMGTASPRIRPGIMASTIINTPGPYTFPAGAGGGMFWNNSGGVVTYDLTSMPQGYTVWAASGADSTGILDPGTGTIFGLVGGTTLAIGKSTSVPIYKQAVGLYYVGHGALSFAGMAFSFANLPLAGSLSDGTMTMCTDCRKSGEGAGSGTGVPVWKGNSFWRNFYDNSIAAN